MRLDQYLPDFFLRELHFLAVRTEPEETYRTICNFDMAGIPWIRALFRMRTMFDPHKPGPFRLTLRDAYADGGFVKLEEEPGEELIVGAIGKIWRPSIAFEKIAPRGYAMFHKAGFGKVAWSLRCEPRIGGGTFCTLEVRVGATDSVSAAKMRSYYSLIGPFSRAIRRSVLHRLARRLGNLQADESNRELPGDSVIEDPVGSLTHGVTIEAPPEAIWPWLVQMGCLRAGWYSYDWLDNAGVSSTNSVVSDWQQIEVGDELNATPQGQGGFFILGVEPFQHLILGGCYDLDSHKATIPNISPLPPNYFRTTWTFFLERQTPNITRLIVRARGDYRATNGIAPHLRTILMPPIHSFMERKQLRNLKQRAETLAKDPKELSHSV